jgi:hypothetical protein
MEQYQAGGRPEWETFTRAWMELGLGSIVIDEPGPGLLEIRVFCAESPPVEVSAMRELLSGLLESLAGEPVGVSSAPVPAPGTVEPVRFFAGSPRLLSRIAPGLEAGQQISNLMEEAWT